MTGTFRDARPAPGVPLAVGAGHGGDSPRPHETTQSFLPRGLGARPIARGQFVPQAGISTHELGRQGQSFSTRCVDRGTERASVLREKVEIKVKESVFIFVLALAQPRSLALVY